MKKTTLVAFAASLLSVDGLVLRKSESSAPKVVGLDLHRATVPYTRNRRDMLRKRGSVQASLDNLETLYFVNGSLGTPAQPMRFHLDTGSSDLWVNTASSTLCKGQGTPCSVSGTYSANDSSTYNYVGSWFNISYVDGSGASGDYVTDKFTIGGSSLTDFQFGVGYTSSSAQGILGLGYKVNEVQVGRAGLQPYDNLPAKMVAEGLIQSSAFSLYLNDLDASQGSILFGGVDTAHFEGELKTVPIQKESDAYAEFLITLTKVALGSKALEENMALAVLLDSGSSLTYLPDDMATTIFSMVGAVYQQAEGVAFIPCSAANTGANMTFTFSEATVTVPIDELVLDLVAITGKRTAFSNGVDACLFGIAPAGTGTNVLGDTFLRSAYVVYDIDNNEISLAQTKFNATSTNILEIGKGSGSVPSAVAVANPVSATNGLVRGGGGSGGGGSQNAAPSMAPLAASLLAGSVAFAAGFSLYLV
ncbi:eukaryotic aspartyl protease [Colletotrichum higginsianum]|uniref:Probable aspartic-type endopeptidase OPSB n=2 Tax=Colletotrichum higginsianum TaxID=80884 RepID=H1VTJ0_COLHI|nr:Eukaryotic aspartyl protease [Colletotrichum higginsianum IMI 349063]OBR13566.1 Eukaryotic aspartyl protease [Colletotrichum higginsianum IMI 349063]TID01318.1 putative aspartic-type endopeptidase opsB [Colletotrichum higginsianum]CCF43548.1 eukaryotic aspartyl protease [Colletotrichum higginsianum]